MKILKQGYEILDNLDGMEILRKLEVAGRTAYKSEANITDDSAIAFINTKIMKPKHLSVIEHVSFSVRFIIDRGISHELVRHRLSSFTQESTRYVDYNNDTKTGGLAFIEPPQLTCGERQIWSAACANAEKSYRALRAENVPPQIARSVLPTCLKTEIVMTANLRQWREVLTQRTASGAHPQIRTLMISLLLDLQSRIPVIFDGINE